MLTFGNSWFCFCCCIAEPYGLYVRLLLLTCVPFSQAWRDLSQKGKSRAGDTRRAMTPGQGAEAKEREVMLKRIAKLAKQQGSFHLACKKYT